MLSLGKITKPTDLRIWLWGIMTRFQGATILCSLTILMGTLMGICLLENGESNLTRRISSNSVHPLPYISLTKNKTASSKDISTGTEGSVLDQISTRIISQSFRISRMKSNKASPLSWNKMAFQLYPVHKSRRIIKAISITRVIAITWAPIMVPKFSLQMKKS